MAQNRRLCGHCGKRAMARGMCSAAYQKWRKATPLHERTRMTPANRFWAKVDRNGPTPPHVPTLGNCWLWTGATGGDWGYGHLTVNKKWCVAHRRSYEMAFGAIPSGLLVLHRCDTPACVRPSHLRLGTAKDNTSDMRNKGRAADAGAPGMRNAKAKLTDEQVLAIRSRFDAGELIAALAVEHEVHRATISAIVNGRRWKHLEGPIRKPGQIGRRPRKEAA